MCTNAATRRFTPRNNRGIPKPTGGVLCGVRSQDPWGFENYAPGSPPPRKSRASDPITRLGRLEGLPYHLGVKLRLHGGSMGCRGEKVRMARRSADKRLPLVLVCTSAAARMQRGPLPEQMAKTSAARQLIRRHSVHHHPHTDHRRRSRPPSRCGDAILRSTVRSSDSRASGVIKHTIGQTCRRFQPPSFCCITADRRVCTGIASGHDARWFVHAGKGRRRPREVGGQRDVPVGRDQ